MSSTETDVADEQGSPFDVWFYQLAINSIMQDSDSTQNTSCRWTAATGLVWFKLVLLILKMYTISETDKRVVLVILFKI